MSNNSTYELVIGLEVHARLQTASKLFCGDPNSYGGDPNTHISAITLAHPGTLPKMNATAIRHAIKLGIAVNCEIEQVNYFARKNYFYPDLPKGYQVSQHTTPICKGGFVAIKTAEGERHIQLNRIHMEEDAGKSIHDASDTYTCLDYNRAGTPLVEIVTEPDLHTAEEVAAYLTELRKTVRYLAVCDGNMEEGSFRCDVNISVREKGVATLGTKVEIKNLNSIKNAKRAVEAEAERLISLVSNGEAVIQQTRGFDVNTGKTFAIRDKEDADDYRYFADPDLPPFNLTNELIEEIKASITALPAQRINRYVQQWGLSEYDALILTEEKTTADFFEALVDELKSAGQAKAAANWMLGPVRSWQNEQGAAETFPISAAAIAGIIQLIDDGKISFSSASTQLFVHLIKHPEELPLAAAERLNLIQQSDSHAIEPIVDAVLAQMEDKVAAYKKGKKGLLALFVGEVMKRSKGKADPKVTNAILLEKLGK